MNLCTADAQIVKDPLLDYYQAIRSGDIDILGDEEPHYSSRTKIYEFEADFTGHGRKSVFIANDESRQGAHGAYNWTVYYPLKSGAFQRLARGVSTSIDGPPFIGYVTEINRYGIVDSGRHVVSVQYMSDGEIKITFLGKNKNQEAEKEDYPKYFAVPTKLQIIKFTLGQVEKTYTTPDLTNVITPAPK